MKCLNGFFTLELVLPKAASLVSIERGLFPLNLFMLKTSFLAELRKTFNAVFLDACALFNYEGVGEEAFRSLSFLSCMNVIRTNNVFF